PPDHAPTTTFSEPPFTVPAASRYSVVAEGVTSTENEESDPIVSADPACQAPPGARCSSVTPFTCSARPPSRTPVPSATLPARRDRRRTPTLTQPERRPSARRMSPKRSGTSPSRPIAITYRGRPVAGTGRSPSRPGTPSLRPTMAAGITTGPQLCQGDA